MKYVITDISIAESFGFQRELHRCKEIFMVLSEKEVMNSPALGGTLEERVSSLRGVICTQEEALDFMR